MHNTDMVKALGASVVFDHTSPKIVDDVVAALANRRLAGTLHVTGDLAAIFSVVSRCEGVRAVAATLPPAVPLLVGVTAAHIHRTLLIEYGIGQMIYRTFLPRALAMGTYIAAPSARIIGQGLTALQDASAAQKAGVSAAKIVVTLAD